MRSTSTAKVDKRGIPEGGTPHTSVTYLDEKGVERFRCNQGNVKGDYSVPEVHTKDMMKCPKHVPPKEWVYACERAKRARKYAAMFDLQTEDTVTTLLVSKYQDPVWQWENEVKGRFGGIVGGNLKP